MRLLFWGAVTLAVGWGIVTFVGADQDSRESLVFPPRQTVNLIVNDQILGSFTTDQTTVGGFLASLHLPLGEGDMVWPGGSDALRPGLTIRLSRSRPITLQVDGKKETIQTNAKTTEDILSERGIMLDEDDIIEPARTLIPPSGTTIRVTRVEIREEHKETPIDFATKTDEDDDLSWRTKKVTQKGEKGLKRITYRVSYHDGKEVRRKVLGSEIIKEPVTEIVTQGTLVKVGKSHRGAASWYAWTGTMAAANPWLPKGSYVRVTNLDNGKSVIVVINDRGPFVPGRIIDLDKVAFQKIASIGAGVINVKMEEIVN